MVALLHQHCLGEPSNMWRDQMRAVQDLWLPHVASRPGRMRCTEVGAGICDQFNHEMQLLMVRQVELAQTWRQPTGTQEITLAIKELEVITTHHLGGYVLYCKRKIQVRSCVLGGWTCHHLGVPWNFRSPARGGNSLVGFQEMFVGTHSLKRKNAKHHFELYASNRCLFHLE